MFTGECGSPPSVDNGTVAFNDTLEGDMSIYSCSTGYAFDNTASSIEVACENSGSWQTVNASCLSE